MKNAANGSLIHAPSFMRSLQRNRSI
jgi:hypothetical protein